MEWGLFQFQAAGFDTRQIEDIVDQPQQRLARLARLLCVAALRCRQFGHAHQFDHPDHTIQRGANFVAHVGQKLGLGLVGHLRRTQRLHRLGRLAPQIVQHGIERQTQLPDFAWHRAAEFWDRDLLIAIQHGLGGGGDGADRTGEIERDQPA